MKKILIAILLISSASVLYSEDISLFKSGGKSDKKIRLEEIDDKLEGKAKLGLSLGYPTGVTFGYQITKLAEINATAGLFEFDTVSFGINTLFTLFDIEGSKTVFPVSAGPALFFHTGNNAKIDITAVIRAEYDFDDIPLNIFLEGGAGLRISPDTKSVASGALGIRYIF